ncbi:MlaE family ABC transporter permease [Draconibacterium halophilum]|uniref:ABC transporter permease n=1 Tax=Draconibacterium halophilum TaxID=2706887 RepID=A0A6C0RH07_9BACT|nr:ABC transporter permease [Draconibacterium halophilum]QIA09327.1 ABC transporter permease [Draconibacterium halophilum]
MRKIKLKLNSSIENILVEVGDIILFTIQVVKQFFVAPFEHRELLKQGYYIGNKTLPLVTITGFIMGLVLTIQSRPVLVEFGAQSLLPGMISISVVREIGPVITALLCAGKIGSGIGAELGAMKVTEQLDAMEVSGTKPLNFVVATRVMATTLLVPLLVIFADAVALIGSFVAVRMFEDVSFVLFISRAFDSLSFSDVIPATIKTFFFGFFIGLIGTYKGYHTNRGTESVGHAANSAVVTASLAIFVIDLLAVQLSNLIFEM